MFSLVGSPLKVWPNPDMSQGSSIHRSATNMAIILKSPWLRAQKIGSLPPLIPKAVGGQLGKIG